MPLSLLLLSLPAMAAEDFAFADCSDFETPDNDFFLIPTIPQRFIDEANGNVIVPLNDADYRDAAQRLGVEVAAIKAVVEIETGRQHSGFFAPRKPIIYFDAKIFQRNCQQKGIFIPESAGHIYSGHGANQELAHQRFSAASSIDSITAFESTFWGMFQIGGFNWKLCGADNIHDFVEKMCYSERTQLELFTNFLTNTGLIKFLRDKNWSAFARYYNGPKYARWGYHTRMARAYKKHSKEIIGIR